MTEPNTPGAESADERWLDDGFGNRARKCDIPECELHIVRPGEFACSLCDFVKEPDPSPSAPKGEAAEQKFADECDELTLARGHAGELQAKVETLTAENERLKAEHAKLQEKWESDLDAARREHDRATEPVYAQYRARIAALEAEWDEMFRQLMEDRNLRHAGEVALEARDRLLQRWASSNRSSDYVSLRADTWQLLEGKS